MNRQSLGTTNSFSQITETQETWGYIIEMVTNNLYNLSVIWKEKSWNIKDTICLIQKYMNAYTKVNMTYWNIHHGKNWT